MSCGFKVQINGEGSQLFILKWSYEWLRKWITPIVGNILVWILCKVARSEFSWLLTGGVERLRQRGKCRLWLAVINRRDPGSYSRTICKWIGNITFCYRYNYNSPSCKCILNIRFMVKCRFWVRAYVSTPVVLKGSKHSTPLLLLVVLVKDYNNN